MAYFKGNQSRSAKWIQFKRGMSVTFKGYIIIASIATLVYVILVAGMTMPRNPVYAEVQTIKEVEMTAPVMDRIAKCESSGLHKKDGQVIFKTNTDGSVDIGRYQINSIWNKQATKLGYDLTNEVDNKAFAMWLYKNNGTGPWSASSKCWNK